MSTNPMPFADMNGPREDEMLDASHWLGEMLSRLRDDGQSPASPSAEISAIKGWGAQCGMSWDQTPLRLSGQVYLSGLSSHANSALLIRLPAAARRVTGRCGVHDNPVLSRNTHALTFSVEVAGHTAWQSGPLTVIDAPAQIDAPLSGATAFTLHASGPLPMHEELADWVELEVAMVDGSTLFIGKPATDAAGFSFTYDGRPSQAFLASWPLQQETLPVCDGVVLRRFTRTDPKTGLAVICELKEHTRYPVLEWCVHFRNTSQTPTPVLEDIRSLDAVLFTPRAYLNYWSGDTSAPDAYEPFRVSLAHGQEYRFAPVGGRPTNFAWPYYNLESSLFNQGMIIVVGWSGQWASAFRGVDEHCVHIAAGQQLAHFSLQPGEEARTPLSLLLFYHGDVTRGQNLWRRWRRDVDLPRPGGATLRPLLACAATDEGEEFTAATEDNQIRYYDRCQALGIHPDVWWIDAGWYPCRDTDGERRWPLTGSWEPDPERFPRGLRPIAAHIAKQDAQLLLWFEPERVTAGSQLDREHPEWLLKSDHPVNRLLNLGDPNCRQWLTDHICRLIQQNGIRIYRQDFNFDSLEYWRNGEPVDRQGMRENLYVQGYLRFWQELLARNPGLLIDSCASGGRRNDLETMRLSVPLHYTDFGYGNHPVKLAFQRTLFSWMPFFKEFTLSWDRLDQTGEQESYSYLAGASKADSFSFHCAIVPMLFATLDIRKEEDDFPLAAKMIAIWREAAELVLHGDYYPLTPDHRSPRGWVARQFDLPAAGRGLLQAIRLPLAPMERLIVSPQAINLQATYHFNNPETGETCTHSGSELRRDGFTFTLPPRAGAIWHYRVEEKL